MSETITLNHNERGLVSDALYIAIAHERFRVIDCITDAPEPKTLSQILHLERIERLRSLLKKF